MIIDVNRQIVDVWINPYSGNPCKVAFEGKVLVRVEDIERRNRPKQTRILEWDDLKIELLVMRERKMNARYVGNRLRKSVKQTI